MTNNIINTPLIILGGAFTMTGGAFTFTGTLTGNTAVTFPTSGTLATTSIIPTGSPLTSVNDTNITLTLGGSPDTALLAATSMTLGWTGQLGLTRGGTAASLTASNGGIVYSGASALAILAGTATAGQMLRSGASTTPSWSTATFPATGGAAGNILISDGTNYISSTSLWPNTMGTIGKIIRSDGTVNSYSTSTFADTYAVSTILYASASNVVTGLSTTNRASLSTNSTGVPTWLALTDGQLVIGSTAGSPAAASLTAGSGITITPASNSITITATGTSGIVIQRVSTETGAVSSGTTQVPFDDTIPQNNEGDQYMSLAITPTNSAHILVIDILAVFQWNADSKTIMSLFQDTIANALATTITYAGNASAISTLALRHIMTAGTTSSTTFKMRAGPTAATTLTFNGSSASRLFGGIMASSIMITEYTS